MFTCVLCRVLFYEPMTIGCGHTFCRKCLERDRSKNGGGTTCKECGTMHYGLNPTNIRTNVVLSNLIKKWFPDRSRAAELRTEGNKYFEKKDFQRAVTLYSEAISFYEADHLLFSNRSHTYAAVQQYDRALEDAEKVVVLRPNWPKGFFRKGNALYELARYEEAAMAFLQCLALDRQSTLAEENLSKSLHMIVSKPAPDDPESTEWQRQQDATKFQALINGSLDIGALQPHLSTHTRGQLTQLMDDLMRNQSANSASLPSSHATSSSREAVDCGSDEIGDTLRKWFMLLDVCVCAIRETQALAHNWQNRRNLSTGMETNSADVISDIEKNHQRSEADFEAAEPQKIDPDLLNVEDLECSLCYRLFYQPVTTPCGHTFCRQCLDRCLDHQTSCPMCKSSLAEFLAERRSAVTQCLQAVIVTYFREDHVIRQQVHEEEMKELARMGLDRQHDIPIFVCTLGFPTVLCPLHIFEPRYRLMVRQCMESGSRQFGMCTCVGNTEEEFTDYGCMLEVRDVHYFPDGRSLVDTVGGRRFRVLSRGKRDGYNTAKVEFLQDDPISDTELADIQSEQEEVYRSLESWLASLPLFHRARISQHFGNLPDLEMNPAASPNGPAWAWWSIAVLPLDPEVQLDLLASCSYKQRLKVVKQVLGHLNSRFR